MHGQRRNGPPPAQGRSVSLGIAPCIGGRRGWTAMVLATLMVMVAGCEGNVIESHSGARTLIGVEMDQITVGSSVSVGVGMTANVIGAAVEANTVTQVLASNGGPLVGGLLTNFTSVQGTASASNGVFEGVGGSSHIFVEGTNGGAGVDAAATGVASGAGAGRAGVALLFYGLSTNRADLVFGSIIASACCASNARTDAQSSSEAGGSYSSVARATLSHESDGGSQSQVDIAVASSTLPIVDPMRISAALSPRPTAKY